MATDNYREALEDALEALERLTDELRRERDGIVPSETFEAVYAIPGTFTATYAGTLEAGEITRLTFTPAGSDAGYFGPAAELWTGDADGPAGRLATRGDRDAFWHAMTDALTDIGEQPKSSENPFTIHRVPIEWTE
jgi:hypothetical protein